MLIGKGHFINYPIKDLIENFFSHNKINLKENNKKNNFLFEEKYNKIKKYLGNDVFKERNKFYLLFKNEFKLHFIYEPKRKFELNICQIILEQMRNCVCKIKM